MRKLTNTLSPSPKGFQSPKFSDSDFREVRGLGLGRPKSSGCHCCYRKTRPKCPNCRVCHNLNLVRRGAFYAFVCLFLPKPPRVWPDRLWQDISSLKQFYWPSRNFAVFIMKMPTMIVRVASYRAQNNKNFAPNPICSIFTLIKNCSPM
jgi:hypothetical protein